MTTPILTPPPQPVDWRDETVAEVLERAEGELEALATDSDLAKTVKSVWETMLGPEIAKALDEFRRETQHDLTVGEVVDWLFCIGFYSAGIAREAIAGAAAAWNEEWDRLTPCQTWVLARLGTCAYREMMGLPLAADILDWWLTGAIDKDTVARTEAFDLIDGDGNEVRSTVRYIPLSEWDVWNRIGADLILGGVVTAYVRLVELLCHRLNAAPGTKFPGQEQWLVQGNLRYPPSTNSVLEHGRQTLYVETNVQMDSRVDKDLYVLGTSTLLSEVKVRASRTTRPDPAGGPDMDGWEVQIDSWRVRLFDYFDFHAVTGLRVPVPGKGTVMIPDKIFTRLIATPCSGLPEPKNYLIMTDAWTVISPSSIPDCSPKFFFPAGTDCNQTPIRTYPI